MKKSLLKIVTVLALAVLVMALPIVGCASDAAEEGNPFSDFNIEKGSYTMDVILGNAPAGVTVKSPAIVNIVNYEGTAQVEWSGAQVEAMTVDGQKLEPEKTGETVVFQMPLKILDGRIPVTLHTADKGDVECTLRFSGNSYKPYDKYRKITNILYPAILLVLIFLGYYGRVRRKNQYKARNATGIKRGRNK